MPVLCVLPLLPGSRVQRDFRVPFSDWIFRHDMPLLHYLPTHRDLPSTAAAAAAAAVVVAAAAAAGTILFPV